jgi:hypothetical protein
VYYLGPNLPIVELSAFCERVKPDLVLLSLTGITSHQAAYRLLDELASLAGKWPVAIGGQGTHTFEPRVFEERNIELIDDLTALHNRVMGLHSNRILASRT